ncbi:MAG: 2'-5' RNA ligase family protein [Leptolyngbyaceae cyanobacterium]
MVLQRFFIALVPPPEIQASVNEIKQYFAEHYGSRKAFNSPPHVTLQAPFEWSSSEQDELTEGLRQFAVKRVEGAIALRNFGAFPPNVIYADVAQTPYIMALQRDLSAFMATTYRVTDRRYPNFCPHMTVAFRDLTKAAFHQVWPEFSQKPFKADFVAKELTLLRHDGQHWQISQTYPFSPVS